MPRKRKRSRTLTYVDFEKAGFVLIKRSYLRPDGSPDHYWTWMPPDGCKDQEQLLPGSTEWLAKHDAKHPQRVMVTRTKAEREGTPVYHQWRSQ